MKNVNLSVADNSELKSVMYEALKELIEMQSVQPLKTRWLNNQEVCELLNISKRTLQTYRDEGILPYSQIGGKIYYKAFDIEDMLEKHYFNAKSL